ncbi:MAG: helix-turn-helix domain-containing protein [Sutterella wadsworthensis]
MRPRKGRCRIEIIKANIAYKFELMPTREQKRIFAQAAGWRRFCVEQGDRTAEAVP